MEALMTSLLILCILLAIMVTLLIRAEFLERRRQVYLFKPISTTLLVIIILLSYFFHEGELGYKTAILVAMLFCFGGDVSLMFDSKKAFLAGLVLFLTGHIVYAVALVYFNGFISDSIAVSGAITLVSLAIFAYLFSGLKSMKVPVLFYVVVISFMLNSAAMTFSADYFNETQASLLFWGAALFYLSDVILAVNRFKYPFYLNRISLGFYYGGQCMIALSPHFF